MNEYNEKQKDMKYWKSSPFSIIVRAETEEDAIAIAKSKLQLKYRHVIQIRKVEEIDPIDYMIEYIKNRTNYIDITFWMIAFLLVFTIITTLLSILTLFFSM